MAMPGVRGGALRDVLGSGLLPVRRRMMPQLPEPTPWTEHENYQYLSMWGPPVISWFINPIGYSYIMLYIYHEP